MVQIDATYITDVLAWHEMWLLGRELGVRADLTGVDLSHMDLSHRNFTEAFLPGADLTCTFLLGVPMLRAHLPHACLTGACLEGANLAYADLRDADLSNADLTDANLANADITGANLEGAILTGVNTQNIIGQRVLSVQFDTEQKNNLLSFWVDLGQWTTGYFQGTTRELFARLRDDDLYDEATRAQYINAVEAINKLGGIS